MASTGTFVNPGSVLARTAREMVEAHAGGAGPREGMTTCPVCGEPLPCSSGRAAAEVLFAAGLAESSGLVAAYQRGLGSPAATSPGSAGSAAMPPGSPAAGSADSSSGSSGESLLGLRADWPDAPPDVSSAASPFGRPEPAAPGPQAGTSPHPAFAEQPAVSFGTSPGPADDPGSAPPPADVYGGDAEAGADDPGSARPPADVYGGDAEAGADDPGSAPPPADVYAGDAEAGSGTMTDLRAPAVPDGRADEATVDDGPPTWASDPEPASAGHPQKAPPPAGTVRGIARPTSDPGSAETDALDPAFREPGFPDPAFAGPPDQQPAQSADTDTDNDTDPALSLPIAPEPADTDPALSLPIAPEPAAAAPEPEPEPEIDPLLLGPPLFAEQNRPLDAPRFTRRPRPAEPSPQSQPSNWPHPESVWLAAVPPSGDATPSHEPPSHEPPSHEPVDDHPSADLRAGDHPAGARPTGHDGADHPGVPDHPGEPGHPGVLDHPTEPPHHPGPEAGDAPASEDAPDPSADVTLPGPGAAWPPPVPATHIAGPGRPDPSANAALPTAAQPRAHTTRAPLEAPKMGQLNRGLQPTPGRPDQKGPDQKGPDQERPDQGRQAATVAQPRTPRPPLEAPRLGQLNRPPESGFAESGPPESWPVTPDETGTPSGLRFAPPPAEPSAVEQPADKEGPSGLPRKADQS